jgi:hypothetical protein
MAEYAIGEVLGDFAAETAEFAEATHHQPGVQGDHFESAVEVIGDRPLSEERGSARGRHDLTVNLVDQDAVCAPGAPASEDHAGVLLFNSALG